MAYLNYKVDLFTGARPTADLTIANYLGAILPIVNLQNQSNSVIVFIADLHAITDNEPKIIRQYIENTLADYLALGIDPKKTKIYLQSDIAKEISLFTLLFSRHLSVAELLRVPTLKEKIRQKLKKKIKVENANTLLFLYPVMMAGDILLNRAKKVPVGEDQAPHLEITRLLAQRFNKKYGPLFPLPQPFEVKKIKILSLKGKDEQKFAPRRNFFKRRFKKRGPKNQICPNKHRRSNERKLKKPHFIGQKFSKIKRRKRKD